MHRFQSICRKPLAQRSIQAARHCTATNQHIRHQHMIVPTAFVYKVPSVSPNLNFSTMATSAAASQTNTDGKSDNTHQNSDSSNKKKDDSNIFLDNLGKIFLSTIALVLLSLFRSNKGNNAKAALRTDIETAALLDPLEIEDLRLANDHLTKEVWNEIVKEFFGRKSVTYGQFMNGVLNVLRRKYGEGATIECGHLMDRVVVKELERVAAQSKEDEKEPSMNENELPVSFLFAALSLALHSTVADRVHALYDVMIMMQGDATGREVSISEQTVSMSEVEKMVQHLQNTCQLVPDAQIVPTMSNIPYQTYRVGDGAELTRLACKGLEKDNKDVVALDDFYAILKSRSVCAWGECYVKKTDRMATSDR